MNTSETVAWIELDAVAEHSSDDREVDRPRATPPDGGSCSGKLLLLVTRAGVELIRVPQQLH
jgi:hypothetical protein